MKYIKINVLLVTLSLLLAYFLSLSTIGAWGDSITMGSSDVTFVEYIIKWWNNTNGRLSQAIIFASLFQPFRQFIDSPLGYPWWLITAFCFYCVILVPYLVLNTYSKFTNESTKSFKIFFLVFVYATWSINSRTFESFSWFNTSVLCGYALSLTLYCILLRWLFITTPIFIQKIQTRIFLLLISLFFSLLLEPYIAVIPLTIFLVTFFRFSNFIRLKTILIINLYGIVGSILGLAILLSSPGQINRNKSLGIGLHKITESFIFSITYGYRYLLDYEVGSNFIVKNLVFLTHLLLFLFIYKMAFHNLPILKICNHNIPEKNKPYIFLLIMLVVYHCFFCTLLISDYFPTYLSMLPAFILASIYAVVIFKTFTSSNSWFALKWPRRLNLLRTILASLLILLLAKHLNENTKTNLSISNNDTRRLAIYEIIERDYRNKGTTSFAIINCPVASTKFNYSMDPPWGYTAWFEWIGIKDLKIYLQQNYDFPSNWNDGTYKIIDCKKIFN